jgi:hypothetical protein
MQPKSTIHAAVTAALQQVERWQTDSPVDESQCATIRLSFSDLRVVIRYGFSDETPRG